MIFLNFLNSFYRPEQMASHRRMSSLVAILIFLVGCFVMTMPGNVRIKREKDKLHDQFGYNFLTEIPDEAGEKLATLKDYGCKLVDNKLECEEEFTEAKELQITYQYDHIDKNENKIAITRNVYFVLDFFDSENQAKPFYDITKNFDNLPHKEDVENYIVVFYKNDMIVRPQAKLDKKGELVEIREFYYPYADMEGFSFNEFGDTASETSQYLVNKLMNIEVIRFKSTLFNLTLGIVFIISLIIVTIVWLMSRRHGLMKTFREYYNIASICSIPVFVIFFVLFWFLPLWQHMNVIIYFNTIYGLYYLFMVFKINGLPEIY